MTDIAATPPVRPIQRVAFAETAPPSDAVPQHEATAEHPAHHHRRFARLRTPVVGLFFLAPLIGEFLLGDLPLVLLPAILALAPMYGGGALLIRETARHRGMRWPGILLLALAYGVLEEGCATQSLFNPNYVGEHLLRPAYVGWLGTGLLWAFYVVSLHVLGSIGTPIAMVEALTPDRRHTPWLKRRGLIVTGVIFVIGFAIDFAISVSSDSKHFIAPWYRLAEALAVAAVLVVVALRLPRGTVQPGTRPAPGLRVVGAVVFVLVSIYLGLPFVVDALTAWVAVAIQVAVVVVGTVLLVTWGRRAGWGPRAVLTVAFAVLCAYIWQGYKNVGLSVDGVVFLVGNIILDLFVLQLARVAFRRTPAESEAEIEGAADRPAS